MATRKNLEIISHGTYVSDFYAPILTRVVELAEKFGSHFVRATSPENLIYQRHRETIKSAYHIATLTGGDTNYLIYLYRDIIVVECVQFNEDSSLKCADVYLINLYRLLEFL